MTGWGHNWTSLDAWVAGLLLSLPSGMLLVNVGSSNPPGAAPMSQCDRLCKPGRESGGGDSAGPNNSPRRIPVNTAVMIISRVVSSSGKGRS